MSHAVLSPSAASRWLSCTPSARLELQFSDTSSDFAREGTLAHALGELQLCYATAGHVLPKGVALQRLGIASEDDIPAEMSDYVDEYVALVTEKFTIAKKTAPDAILKIEESIDISDCVPECFGTGDAIIITAGVIEIIDLKYGKGVEVSAVNNKQMMLYALGCLYKYAWLFGIHTVRMTIFQPRIGNISEWECSADDIFSWGESIREKAVMAFNGEGEQVPGSHCRFCKAKAVCKALAEKSVEAAKTDFMLLDPNDLAALLPMIDTIKNWANAVEDYTLQEALNGTKYPGFKLVEGRSIRKYSDETKVAQTLIENGFKKEQLYKDPELLNITALEKLLTKKTFSALLSDLILKPQGKPALVPASDKRKELNSVETDFKDVQ
jgi:hypothetical protein